MFGKVILIRRYYGSPAFLYLSAAAGRAGAARPRCRRLGEFRVAVWASSPLRRIDSNVSDLFGRAIDVIARAGAMVDDAAAPPKVRFAPDSQLEGTGFEPSVPRQEKWSMPSSSDQTRVGRRLTLRGGAESSMEGRDVELSV